MRWNSQVQRSIDFFANAPAKGFSQRTAANINNCIFFSFIIYITHIIVIIIISIIIKCIISCTFYSVSTTSSSARPSITSSTSPISCFVKSYQALATSCIATFAWENKRLGYEQIQHLICDMTWVSHDAKWMYCKQRHMETPRLAANFSQQRLKANVNASKKTQMLSGWSMRQGRTGRVPLLARFFKNHCQLHFWNLHANLCGVHVVFSLWFILWSSIVYGHPSLRVADFAQFRLAVALKLLRLGFHHLI